MPQVFLPSLCVPVLAAHPAAIVGVPTPGLQFMPVLNFCAAIWAINSRRWGRTGPICYVKAYLES